jgi:hypothetical protein
MKEKTNLQLCGPEVARQLLRCSRMKIFSGFYFDHHLAVHDHVESMPCDLFTFVEDWHPNFAPDLVAAVPQLASKTGNINLFQKAKSKRVVHFKESSYDRVGQGFVNQFYACHSPF